MTRHHALVALLALGLLPVPPPAVAQDDPAALQLIERLRPTSRGLRVPAEETPPAPSDVSPTPPPAIMATPGAPGLVPMTPPDTASATVTPPTAPPPSPPAAAIPGWPPAAPPSSLPPVATPGLPPVVATPVLPRPEPQGSDKAPAIAAMPTPVPSPVPPPPRETTAPEGVPAVSITVTFATGSWRITPQAEAALAPLGRALSSPVLAPYRFRIEGHTDSVGPDGLNRMLSERRAAAVRDFLVMRYGIAPSRLEAVGFGETQLLVPTPDNIPEARNRRVQVLTLDN